MIPSNPIAQIYDECARNVVDCVVHGQNGTIFAYGPSGAGKTYTMQGTASHNPDERGIMQRAAEHIFRAMGEQKAKLGSDFDFTLRCSYVELHNERFYDLLRTENPVHLRPTANTPLQNATVTVCTTVGDVVRLIELGAKNRRVAETLNNRHSSRSHAIFTVQLETIAQQADNKQLNRMALLNLVDLAGAEQVADSARYHFQRRLRETCSINNSLSVLSRVVRALADGKPHVPYRESKLTLLLQPSLGGDAHTCFVVNLAADQRNKTIVKRCLQFAQSVMQVSNAPQIHEQICEKQTSLRK
ncbi:Kinesin-like protein [Aphelenchoides fujianensis]|nr:Kinesin-like protein [Aphelenchoides fujianensis]